MSELRTLTPALHSGTSEEEFPLFFGSSSGVLYGVFHPARTGFERNTVAVFCHSLGIEHMVTQRMQVLGARVMARAGFSTFRYDSRAHGDSAGEPRDLTFSDLVDDACTAADYARNLSGAAKIVWIGVRFGCLIAAAAIARRNDACALALWEPLHQGEDYFRTTIRTILFCDVARGRRSGATADDLLKRLDADGVLPAVGTYLYRALWHSAQAADLGRLLLNWSGQTLLAQVQRRLSLSASNQHLRSKIEQHEGQVTVALMNQEPAWSMLPLVRPQWTSEPLIAATVEWLHGLE